MMKKKNENENEKTNGMLLTSMATPFGASETCRYAQLKVVKKTYTIVQPIRLDCEKIPASYWLHNSIGRLHYLYLGGGFQAVI